MGIFWLRTIVFSFLWVYMLIVYSNFPSLSNIFFALSLGIYFLLTIPKFLVWKYSVLLLLSAIHGYYLIEDVTSVAVLLSFLVIDASFRMNRKGLISIIIELSVILFVLSFIDNMMFELVLLTGFVSFLSVMINQMYTDRREQQEIYEELLSEYRILKRLHTSAERNARLEERTRIARDIHDSVGHRLTALIMKLEMLHIQEKHPAYEELKEMAKESLEDTRTAVKALQTEESEGIAAVVHLIRKLEAESHLLVQFTLKQGVLSVPITNEMSVVLYRVIQEALTNIMRHGDTRDAQVILSKSATDDIQFEISNNIRRPKPFTMGFGLKNMKERVEELNGNIHIYQTENQFIVTGTLSKGGN